MASRRALFEVHAAQGSIRRSIFSALCGLVLAGATPSASMAAEGDGSSPLSPEVLTGQHDVELVVGDAAADRIDALFLEYDPEYLEEFAARKRRFNALGERLFARAASGQDTRCSRQIFLEAKWLLGYTAWWSRLDARLDDLEASFAVADQSFAAEPSPEDGFYGRCATQMFIRIEDTLVNYFELAGRGRADRRSSASRWRRCVIQRR